MFSPNRSLLDPVDLSLSRSLSLSLSWWILGPQVWHSLCYLRIVSAEEGHNFTTGRLNELHIWSWQNLRSVCPLWVVESSEVKHDTNMGEHRWTPVELLPRNWSCCRHPGSTRVKVQCQRHQTRQQHGAVGRENMPITGLPWQLQIIWVTRICRMGSSMVRMFLCLFQSCSECNAWQPGKYPIKACQDCNNLEELHQRSRTSKCTARPWWDVPFRSVQYVQSACPTVSLFPLFKTNQAVCRAVSEDLWMITSRCLGVWACTHACLCVPSE